MFGYSINDWIPSCCQFWVTCVGANRSCWSHFFLYKCSSNSFDSIWFSLCGTYVYNYIWLRAIQQSRCRTCANYAKQNTIQLSLGAIGERLLRLSLCGPQCIALRNLKTHVRPFASLSSHSGWRRSSCHIWYEQILHMAWGSTQVSHPALKLLVLKVFHYITMPCFSYLTPQDSW